MRIFTDQGVDLAASAGQTVAMGAFEPIYQSYWRPVYRYAWLLSRHREDAEDSAAETFQRAYSAWESGRGPKVEALPWLLVIARRLVINRERRRRLIAWVPLAEARDATASDREGLQSEAWIWFGELSRALPARQHEVLLLRYQFDLTDEAIGRIMGLSPSGVRTLSHRALGALRRHPEVLR
jgi:RNA polymerase sigma factor (sigma-70 family)